MNCESCESLLVDHVHDELLGARPKSKLEDVTAHLAECSACALSFCRLRADVDGIGSAYRQAPSASVANALRARVQAEFRPSWWSRALSFAMRPVPAYGIACAAALPLLVWGTVSGLGGGGVLRAPPERAAPPAKPARIRDYDATEPFRDRRVL